MIYEEAIRYIKEVQKKGSILGLEPVKKLLNYVENPQDQLKVIHVAGTNGKGSVCTFLESLYRAEGMKVGRYISPTLHCYLERFQINGVYMQEEEFAALMTDLLPFVERMEQEENLYPTAFEIETVLAFLYFVKEKVDLVILETGMGGREDATNVVTHPICTVFTEIGMDHMQFLGDTIQKITLEKAGIMKKDCPVVVYPNNEEVLEVLKVESGLHNVIPDIVSKKNIQIIDETLEGSRFMYKGIIYEISMLGEYQIYNAATAIEVKQLLDGGLKKEALCNAKWEGRFEKVSQSPLFIKDGAHNIDGVLALKESIQKHFTNEKLIFIIGVLRDKEHKKMMKLLCPMATVIYTITPQNERGFAADELKEEIMPYCKKVTSCSSVEKAVEQAKKTAVDYQQKGQDAVIVAWGSLSYIGQING